MESGARAVCTALAMGSSSAMATSSSSFTSKAGVSARAVALTRAMSWPKARCTGVRRGWAARAMRTSAPLECRQQGVEAASQLRLLLRQADGGFNVHHEVLIARTRETLHQFLKLAALQRHLAEPRLHHRQLGGGLHGHFLGLAAVARASAARAVASPLWRASCSWMEPSRCHTSTPMTKPRLPPQRNPGQRLARGAHTARASPRAWPLPAAPQGVSAGVSVITRILSTPSVQPAWDATRTLAKTGLARGLCNAWMRGHGLGR